MPMPAPYIVGGKRGGRDMQLEGILALLRDKRAKEAEASTLQKFLKTMTLRRGELAQRLKEGGLSREHAETMQESGFGHAEAMEEIRSGKRADLTKELKAEKEKEKRGAIIDETERGLASDFATVEPGGAVEEGERPWFTLGQMGRLAGSGAVSAKRVLPEYGEPGVQARDVGLGRFARELQKTMEETQKRADFSLMRGDEEDPAFAGPMQDIAETAGKFRDVGRQTPDDIHDTLSSGIRSLDVAKQASLAEIINKIEEREAWREKHIKARREAYPKIYAYQQGPRMPKDEKEMRRRVARYEEAPMSRHITLGNMLRLITPGGKESGIRAPEDILRSFR